MTTWNENLPCFLRYNTENFLKFLRKNSTTTRKMNFFTSNMFAHLNFFYVVSFWIIFLSKRCEYFLVLEFFRRVLTIATIRKLWGPQINLNIHRRNHFSWFIYNFIYLIFLNAKVSTSFFCIFTFYFKYEEFQRYSFVWITGYYEKQVK